MKKSKKKKKNTRILNNYLGMALISVVVVLLLGVLTVQSNELKAKISSYDTICRQMNMWQRSPETVSGLSKAMRLFLKRRNNTYFEENFSEIADSI